ncbi:MAG TPA: hypothetical protein VGG36_00805 [Rhizomicrobium sp.]
MIAVPQAAFAIVLALASALSLLIGGRARRSARDYLRFAAALYAALALVDLALALAGQTWSAQLAATVALIVAALAPATLALAVACRFEAAPRTLIAAPVLLLACLAGLVAAVTGEVFIAMAPLAASVCALLALCVRGGYSRARAQVFVSACALLAAAAALSSGESGRTAFALFSAAALLGISLAATMPSHRTVEQRRKRLDLRVRRQN